MPVFENYPSKLIQKLESYLSAKKNNKLILTDAIKWEFYIKNKEDKKIELIRTFRLYELYNVREWTWKKEEFEELKNFLKEFLKKEED